MHQLWPDFGGHRSTKFVSLECANAHDRLRRCLELVGELSNRPYPQPASASPRFSALWSVRIDDQTFSFSPGPLDAAFRAFNEQATLKFGTLSEDDQTASNKRSFYRHLFGENLLLGTRDFY